MTTAALTTERLAEAVGNLIDQFQGQANFTAFIEAWAQQSQEVETAAFGVLNLTTLASGVGVQLDGLGEVVGVERGGLSDTDFRLRIAAQILLNLSSGTIEELLQLAVALGAATVTLTETYPAKIAVVSTSTVIAGAQIGAVLSTAKAGGVGFTFTWFEGTNPFLFDTAGQGFDQGELGEMIRV